MSRAASSRTRSGCGTCSGRPSVGWPPPACAIPKPGTCSPQGSSWPGMPASGGTSQLAAWPCSWPATASRHLRLPYHPRGLVVVGDRFDVKPLLPLLCGDGRFYLLALSQRRVRLFEGDRDGLQALALRDVPADLAEAMRFDDRHEQLQLHQTGPARPAGRPAAPSMATGWVPTTPRTASCGTAARSTTGCSARSVTTGRRWCSPRWTTCGRCTGPPAPTHTCWPRASPATPTTSTRTHCTGRPGRWSATASAPASGRPLPLPALAHQDLATQDLDRIVLAAAAGQVEALLVPLDSERWGTTDSVTGAVQLHREPDPELSTCSMWPRSRPSATAAWPTRSNRDRPDQPRSCATEPASRPTTQPGHPRLPSRADAPAPTSSRDHQVDQ